MSLFRKKRKEHYASFWIGNQEKYAVLPRGWESYGKMYFLKDRITKEEQYASYWIGSQGDKNMLPKGWENYGNSMLG